jgi:signal transduction histidine kinase
MSSGAARTGLDVDEILGIVSRPADAALSELVELVARICDSEAAGIGIQRGDEYHVPVTHGIEPLVRRTDDIDLRHTMDVDSLVCIEDTQADPRFAGISWSAGTLSAARFHASAPIHAPGGQMVGRLFVAGAEPKTLSELQRRSLETLARNVTKLIELRVLRAREKPVAPGGDQASATVVSRLAAELSHDMRIPLTSIIASVEMLEDQLGDYPDPAVGDLLERTTRAADRMARMLEQNMDLGLQSDAPVTRAVDLARVVRQLVADSATLLEQRGATVEVEDLPVVFANPDNMYSVLQNLVMNSVIYARPDVPAVVRIFAGRARDGWRITVQDNGVGIPEHRRVDIFSLFSRVDRDVAGHGIGLATVARIVTAHGGRVGAEAAPGGGAQIWFELPGTAAHEQWAG